MTSNLYKLDIYDLHILNLLFKERSVSRVAQHEAASQPAISKILSRLRRTLGDNLLVKSGQGFDLTDRAMLLREPVRDILSKIALMDADAPFDAATSERIFQIGYANCVAPSLLAGIIDQVARQNPKIRLHLVTLDPYVDVGNALENGALDLLINNHPKPREDLRTSALYTDDVVCLMHEGHALANQARMRLASYLEARHLAPTQIRKGDAAPISDALTRAGYRRNVVATTPEYNLVPYILLKTDLIFTTGRQFAEEQARHFPLKLVPAPFEIEPLRFYQLWHERRHNSLPTRWLRNQIRAAAAAQFR